MPLPINIEDLLAKNKVESNRIEFKEGWNPDSIYHSICAFANDFDNIGGGYILIGVREENGLAQRPVMGLCAQQLDKIQREIVSYNNLINPYYTPKISVEEIDDRYILVLWITSGVSRPYQVPENITARNKVFKPYIRYGTSSIVARGEQLQELQDMANQTPFDERPNQRAKISDISAVLVRDYLVKVKSKLASQIHTLSLEQILERMDLLAGTEELRYVKNLAVMMFCENPEHFFPYTQVDIVIFHNGKVQDPDNFIEMDPIMGPVPVIVRSTLNYLRTNVIQKKIHKQKEKEESVIVYNYPYQALEEAVVNALYHRDYSQREPVEIVVEPDRISILSCSGPDRSISKDALLKAENLRCRRYRNRRLGDFLKELELTEGRSTGIPTIQKELRENGSAPALLETDEDRTYFLIDIPCHPHFLPVNPTQFIFGDKLSKVVKNILLNLSTGEKGRSELLAFIGVPDNSYYKGIYITPLIQQGLVETTREKTSPNQAYRITQQGVDLINFYNKSK